MAALETFAATRSELFAELQEDLEQRGNPSVNISRFLDVYPLLLAPLPLLQNR